MVLIYLLLLEHTGPIVCDILRVVIQIPHCLREEVHAVAVVGYLLIFEFSTVQKVVEESTRVAITQVFQWDFDFLLHDLPVLGFFGVGRKGLPRKSPQQEIHEDMP